MMVTGSDRPLANDSEIDALAWQFLSSDYADDAYANWPLDRRLDGFLRRRSLTRRVDGDSYNLLLNRIMINIATTSSSFPEGRRIPARRPGR